MDTVPMAKNVAAGSWNESTCIDGIDRSDISQNGSSETGHRSDLGRPPLPAHEFSEIELELCPERAIPFGIAL
jgi:hypothetical protein